jgi:hypothetical protein
MSVLPFLFLRSSLARASVSIPYCVFAFADNQLINSLARRKSLPVSPASSESISVKLCVFLADNH